MARIRHGTASMAGILAAPDASREGSPSDLPSLSLPRQSPHSEPTLSSGLSRPTDHYLPRAQVIQPPPPDSHRFPARLPEGPIRNP